MYFYFLNTTSFEVWVHDRLKAAFREHELSVGTDYSIIGVKGSSRIAMGLFANDIRIMRAKKEYYVWVVPSFQQGGAK